MSARLVASARRATVPKLALEGHVSRRAAALPHALDTMRQALNSLLRGGRSRLNLSLNGQPNKSLEMTANSAAFIRKTPCLMRFIAASQFQRSAALIEYERQAQDLPPACGARLHSVQWQPDGSRCAAALPPTLDTARRALNNPFRGGRPALRRFNHGQPNKSLEMTGMSVNVIRRVGGFLQSFPASQFRR